MHTHTHTYHTRMSVEVMTERHKDTYKLDDSLIVAVKLLVEFIFPIKLWFSPSQHGVRSQEYSIWVRCGDV